MPLDFRSDRLESYLSISVDARRARAGSFGIYIRAGLRELRVGLASSLRKRKARLCVGNLVDVFGCEHVTDSGRFACL